MRKGFRHQPKYREQSFDVLNYDATLTFRNPATKMMEGECRMVVKWTTDVDAPTLPFHLRGLAVNGVKHEGADLFAALVGEGSDTMHYMVALGSPVSTDEIDTIVISYSGVMQTEPGGAAWGGVWYEGQVLYALGVGFNNNYVSATQHWLACYDHPSDKATATFRFRVPPSVRAVSNGVLQSVEDVDGDTLREHTWVENHQIATYLMTFATGAFQELMLEGHESVPHVAYSQSEHVEASRESYRLVPEMTKAFEALYGDYPFDKVGYVNTRRGAMEHQTMISFPESVVERRDSVNTTAAHELAHMWFGDLVTPLDFRHAWLTESFRHLQ